MISEQTKLKAELRKQFLLHRLSLSAQDITRRSEKIFENFKSNIFIDFKVPNNIVALYASMRGEVDTQIFFHFFHTQNQRCVFPKIRGNFLDFYPVSDLKQLQKGSFGVMEPVPEASDQILQPSVIFMPGLAFNRQGYRLGYGGGFYDRTLAHWDIPKPLLIGLAYDFQIISDLPHNESDHPVDYVLSESILVRRQP